jgi:hypothetical protein
MNSVAVVSWRSLEWWSAQRVSAFGSLATVAIGGVLGYVGYRISKGQREVAGLGVLREVTDQFFGDQRLLDARRRVTTEWLERHRNKEEGVTNEQDASLRLILNCFQDAAIYVQRKHVPAKVVWDCLSYWVLVYWYVAEGYVGTTRTKTHDKTAWAPVEELVKRLHRQARRKRLKDWSRRPKDAESSLEFFKREAKSLGAEPPARARYGWVCRAVSWSRTRRRRSLPVSV